MTDFTTITADLTSKVFSNKTQLENLLKSKEILFMIEASRKCISEGSNNCYSAIKKWTPELKNYDVRDNKHLEFMVEGDKSFKNQHYEMALKLYRSVNDLLPRVSKKELSFDYI